MALSDMLSELAQRAREAEDRARSASTEAKDKVRQRADEASVSAHQKADELKQRSDAAQQQASDRWAPSTRTGRSTSTRSKPSSPR